MDSSDERPQVHRRSGARKYGAFERTDTVMGGSPVVRKGNVEVRILISKCQWGTLGADERPAGIIFMDIIIHQPKISQLAGATVLVSLAERHDDKTGHDIPDDNSDSSSLQFTQWYGPKRISGIPRLLRLKSTHLEAPSIPALGVGPGTTSAETRVHFAEWTFMGQLLSKTFKNGTRSNVYRTLRWDLVQDEFKRHESSHSKVIHTGFALEHIRKPFFVKVEINEKLRSSRDRLKNKLKFPPSRKNDESIFLIDPSGMRQASRRLDDAAHGLPVAMEQQNMANLWGPNFDPKDWRSRKLLSLAAGSGNLNLVNQLLEEEVKLEEVKLEEEDEAGRTAFSWAAANGFLDVVKLLLEKGAIPDQGDKAGRTPLSWAAANGYLDVVKLLLEKGAIPDQGDKAGRTPLSWAAANGYLDVVKLLLSQGSEHNDEYRDRTDNGVKTALALASQVGHEDIVRTLLQHFEKNGPEPVDGGAGYAGAEVIDGMIKMPLSLAAQDDHLQIMRMLVQTGIRASPDPKAWLSRHLHNAIRDGTLSLVRVMFQFGANADTKSDENERTPLCTAAEYGHVDIVLFLLDSGAGLEDQTAERETPIFLATKNGREEAVKVLLEMGAGIECRNTSGETVMDAAVNYPTILRMIAEKDKDGTLAEEDLHAEINHEFNAKVMFFTASSGIHKPTTPKDIPVSKLLANPASAQAPETDKVSLKWFHLPANNMKWVEVLIFRYCGNRSSAYKILNADRWVGRQHQGDNSAHQARFMQPLCQGFGPAAPSTSSAVGQSPGDKDMVVFMPYLHWEENERLDSTKSFIKKGTSQSESASWTKDQRLLYAYLFKDNPHPLHLLHIRRTLDQFCYYTLSDTDERDQDQTITRYQRKFSTEPKVTVMVDQLWMWVLVGASGRADTVITCFPRKDYSNAQAHSGPDPDGFTDILQNIMLYMLYEPQAVKTAYDLAGIIASRCSRAFLGPSRARKILQFAEIYESAISDIVNQETELFDMFRNLTEFRRKGPDPAEVILDILRKVKANKYVDPIALGESVQKYYNDTLSQEIPDTGDVAVLVSRGALNMDKICEILQKLGNFHVLDISREITLLRDIKDIQDELNIMGMVFEDQTSVLKEMENIVRYIGKNASSSKDVMRPKELSRSRHYRADSDGMDTDVANRARKRRPRTSELNHTIPSAQASGSPKGGSTEDPEAEEHYNLESESLHEERNEAHEIFDDNVEQTVTFDGDYDAIPRSQVFGVFHQYVEESQPASEVWGSSRDPKHSSLPLSTLQLSVDQIERMAQRAAKANQALDFLVDLKQKQSNVMDARSARIQAKESLKMTKEAEKQGKTLVVFTIVTIVFLPLSFMAAFFAINITQFRHDEGGTLSLGYVLEIMIPISVVVSASFIYIAFKAESFESIVAGLGRLPTLFRANTTGGLGP